MCYRRYRVCYMSCNVLLRTRNPWGSPWYVIWPVTIGTIRHTEYQIAFGSSGSLDCGDSE